MIGTAVDLGLRQEGFLQTPNDVYAVRWTGGGGYGDPLDRDLEALQAGLDGYAVTRKGAEEIFGAVLDAAGRIDAAATSRAAFGDCRRAQGNGAQALERRGSGGGDR